MFNSNTPTKVDSPADESVVSEPQEPVAEPKPEPEPVVVEPVDEPEPVINTEASEVPTPVVDLPELDNSDDFIMQELKQISVSKSLLSLILSDDLIRRSAVVIDNFARGDIAYKHLPLKPLDSKYQVVEQDNDAPVFNVNRQNWERYQQYIDLFLSFEPEQLVATYQNVRPLLVNAYAELGYSEQDFERAVQACLQRILDAKVASGREVLIQPKVVYTYQDSELESLPDADKLLLRLGPENLMQLKAIALELDRAMAAKAD
ncbi:DUF3014 domain-containing protein [Thalassotalea ponticola]|uniref:DUF3014 domain-containing protein n=1 Tax=Thalassotalea ponticola TaxID=1523392 RepID=UPI0025B2E208|nr:DUF3014 domain-containing protein [Thalassotalea ponticola]MDN3653180.1 DUF3014 domain-containing protein [Thalassotalea ponticola]